MSRFRFFPFIIYLHFLLILLINNGVISNALKVGFYDSSCPQAEYITKRIIDEVIVATPSLSGPLLRLNFHDCFVRGCDASILLNSPTKQAEKDASPNQSLRGLYVIEKVKTALERACPGVVSCADIIALIARDVVTAVGGPCWKVETGRRDGNISSIKEALANLPSATANISSLKASFQQKGLTNKDLVVLSAAHTIGISHCASFKNRLYNYSGKGDDSSDPNLDAEYTSWLKMKCKKNGANAVVAMDPGSYISFDEHYFELVSKKKGLFNSDAALLDDPETKSYVQSHTYGSMRESFFNDFGVSMVNLGRLGVLTGNRGEIRRVCYDVNHP